MHSGMSRTRRSKIPEAAASIQIQDTNNDPVLLDLWQLRVVEGETVPRGDDVVQEVEPDSAISQLIAAASHLDVGGHREDLHEDIEQGHGGGVEEEDDDDDDEEEEEEEEEDDDEGNSDASDDEEHRELRECPPSQAPCESASEGEDDSSQIRSTKVKKVFSHLAQREDRLAQQKGTCGDHAIRTYSEKIFRKSSFKQFIKERDTRVGREKIFKHPSYAKEFIVWMFWTDGADHSSEEDSCRRSIRKYLEMLFSCGMKEGKHLSQEDARDLLPHGPLPTLYTTAEKLEDYLENYFLVHRKR